MSCSTITYWAVPERLLRAAGCPATVTDAKPDFGARRQLRSVSRGSESERIAASCAMVHSQPRGPDETGVTVSHGSRCPGIDQRRQN
jgi:hypothetical protein